MTRKGVVVPYERPPTLRTLHRRVAVESRQLKNDAGLSDSWLA